MVKEAITPCLLNKVRPPVVGNTEDLLEAYNIEVAQLSFNEDPQTFLFAVTNWVLDSRRSQKQIVGE